jgi:YYY domain-containing protein
MIALPITVLVIVWVLSVVAGRWYRDEDRQTARFLGRTANFVLAAVAIGALYPTNTWDYYPYLLLAICAIFYTIVRYGSGISDHSSKFISLAGDIGWAILVSGALFGFSRLLYLPFTQWFAQGYNEVTLWEGAKSPLWSYITHWGLFLFAIVSWLTWETIDWMASTPVSALRKLSKYQVVIQGIVVILIAGLITLALSGVSIGWVALSVAAWAGILIIRPALPDVKRLVLFFIGTGMALTLLVEVVVLKGDIGRMNTVFKFYLQAWTLLSISAAASFAWLLSIIEKKWSAGLKIAWQMGISILIAIALLFPLLATIDKVRDRISILTPHTLDGIAYMEYSKYNDQGRELELKEDSAAIRWLQDNVQGSPVILEGYTPEYRWGGRYSINTGLPAVIGWNWHQRQQRGVVDSDWVTQRVDEVNRIYNTLNKNEVENFINRYDVSYIIVGQLEHAYYSIVGLSKFDAWNGDLWEKVFEQGQTVIYKVRK